jgi:hypothetical protein
VREPHLYILDDRGTPQPVDDVLVWGRWFEQTNESGERIVARDRDEGPNAEDVRVSTVFLGLDHNWSDDGPPILWETLVFGGSQDGTMRRYRSREDALRGHREVCREVFNRPT